MYRGFQLVPVKSDESWQVQIFRNGLELRMKIVIGVAMIVAVLVIGCCLAMQFACMREVR